MDMQDLSTSETSGPLPAYKCPETPDGPSPGLGGPSA